MGKKWNDQWWSLVKAEKHSEVQHERDSVRRATTGDADKVRRVRRRRRGKGKAQ